MSTPTPGPAGPTPAQAGTDGRRWIFASEGSTAYLGYGTPESDDVLTGLSCERGAGKVVAVMPVERWLADREAPGGKWMDANGRIAPWPAEVTVEVDGRAQAYDARLDADLLNGGSLVTVEVPVTDLRSLAKGSKATTRRLRFRVSDPGLAKPLHEVVEPPPAPARTLDDFLDACTR